MLLDTSAWIELFQETDRTAIVKNALETEENFTSAITFAEMVNWCFRNKKDCKELGNGRLVNIINCIVLRFKNSDKR